MRTPFQAGALAAAGCTAFERGTAAPTSVTVAGGVTRHGRASGPGGGSWY